VAPRRPLPREPAHRPVSSDLRKTGTLLPELLDVPLCMSRYVLLGTEARIAAITSLQTRTPLCGNALSNPRVSGQDDVVRTHCGADRKCHLERTNEDVGLPFCSNGHLVVLPGVKVAFWDLDAAHAASRQSRRPTEGGSRHLSSSSPWASRGRRCWKASKRAAISATTVRIRELDRRGPSLQLSP